MLNLEDPKIIKKYDRSGMEKLIATFPEQCEEAVCLGLNFKIDGSFKRRYKFVVCTGLGGSAIGADIARSYLLDEAPTPIFVNRNYTLPAFVGPGTLVIVSSYSGDTEETLGAYRHAISRKAKIVVITSGGKLSKFADRDGVPVIAIPESFPPRAALGYSFFPLLILLSKIGIASDKTESINNTIETLKEIRHKNGTAKPVARSLYLKYPVIYSAQDHMDAVAIRWKGQLAENAKTFSSCNVFPEMTHNEIVGLENPGRLLKDLEVVILRDSGDHSRIAKRMDIAAKIIKKAGMKIIEVNSSGKSLLARMFSLIYTGDLVSFYLAILNKRDPTPVERITYFKKELAKA